MARIVMKFGGTSTANTQNLRICAKHVARKAKTGQQIVVVVSAPAGMTDQLIARIEEADPTGQHLDEADVVLAAGEQINAGLMVMCLRELGLAARSWLGWQAGLITDENFGKARLATAKTDALLDSLVAGEIVVLAGFQGVTPSGRISTLGRGGSDVSAVALASALAATRCDIYTDVQGVFSADPAIVPTAELLTSISAAEMLEMASSGAKVLHGRSVELAMAK
ncbi:Aspartokinase, partial [hydrothermal vent metagenome]